MRIGNIAALRKKLNDAPRRLTRFIVHDVRRNPILGLYVVIAVMVIGYVSYSAVIIYEDIVSGGDKRIASKSELEKTQRGKPPPKVTPSERKAEVKTPAKESSNSNDSNSQTKVGRPNASKVRKEPPQEAQKNPDQGTTATVSQTKQVAAKSRHAVAKELDRPNWRQFEFPDSSRIAFPADWSMSEIPAEKNIVYGIRLHAPGTDASLQCYSRSRQLGDDLAKSLRKTMSREGKVKIKERTRTIDGFNVAELSGVLADKRMIVSIFDHQRDKYFIVSMISAVREYEELQPHYGAIVESYVGAGTSSASAMSIENIEQQLQKTIEEDKEYLVGSLVKIKLNNGARHKGVVIAEDDNSFTIEGFRFGGKYSFTVKKTDVAEITY
ncbi:MAG: hypothetical protein JSU72_05845 [Deltaproteobacteria bacterium]|nr:MAG: hypothetical protein JSU72_05845 [Deltaproteobacteria bacterium]